MTGTRAAVGFAVLVSVFAACDDGGPPARGFGSRQLLAVRDSELVFKGGWGNLAFYATGPADNPRYWSIDVDSGEVREHDDKYSDVPVPDVGGSTNLRYVCQWSWNAMRGVSQLTVTDSQTVRETVIGDIVSLYQLCPADADPTLSVWRQDDAGRLALWTGPFDSLQPAVLDVEVVVRHLVLQETGVHYVLASTLDQLDALGLYRIDLRTFAVTLVIQPALADAAWAPGTMPGGPLESSTLTDTGVGRWSLLGDRFLYERTMSDGGVTIFTGPFEPPAARELALFRLAPNVSLARIYLPLAQVAGAPRTPVLTAWRQFDKATGTPQFVHVWQEERPQLASCPLSSRVFESLAQTTPDWRHVLLFPRPSNFDLGIHELPGPVVLVTPDAAGADGSGGCVELASDAAVSAGLSHDATALFWLIKRTPGGSDHELWTAASDGSAPRLLGRGDIKLAQFVGPSQLEIGLGQDLAWLDVHDDPVHMTYIADDVFGSAIALGRWLVTGYQRNYQVGNGRLGVVNRDTGKPLEISPEVVNYVTPDRNPYAYDGAAFLNRPTRVVYLVRGRNPSPQDGLWLATVDGAELP